MSTTKSPSMQVSYPFLMSYRNRRIVSRDFFPKFSPIFGGAAYFQVRLTYASDTRKSPLWWVKYLPHLLQYTGPKNLTEIVPVTIIFHPYKYANLFFFLVIHYLKPKLCFVLTHTPLISSAKCSNIVWQLTWISVAGWNVCTLLFLSKWIKTN